MTFTSAHTRDITQEGSRTATFEGRAYGSGVSFFLVDNDPGQGPALHLHPYTETWVVLSGRAVLTADGHDTEVGQGDIGVVAAETPHKFRNVGPGPLRMMCIHDSPVFIQDNLDDDSVGTSV